MNTGTCFRYTLIILTMLFCGAMVAAQSLVASPEPAASTTPAPVVPVAPVTGTPIMGTWKIERAVFELFGSLKDVTGQDDRFYNQFKLENAFKGSLRYGVKPEEIEIEYDVRNGQTLTIAFGSRLKPQIDLYNYLIMADGSLFLRSTRLAQVNGTVFYICRKVN